MEGVPLSVAPMRQSWPDRLWFHRRKRDQSPTAIVGAEPRERKRRDVDAPERAGGRSEHGQHSSAAVERGLRWLAQTQRADGSWDEPQYTGTGFPGDFYINYHLYRLAFPLSALGRYVTAHTSGGSA